MLLFLDRGTTRVNFLAEGFISAAVNSIIKLEDVHLAQAINKLEACNFQVGMLINSGETSLIFKRLIDTKFESGKSNQTK